MKEKVEIKTAAEAAVVLARADGYKAYGQYVYRTANPYGMSGDLSRAWDSGWTKANEDAKAIIEVVGAENVKMALARHHNLL